MALNFRSGTASFEIAGSSGKVSTSLPGAQVGDLVARVWSYSTSGDFSFDWTDQYEPVITIADEIQKNTYGDQTGLTLTGILIR